MRPWNPHAQTFHGEPVVGQTPVRVVVRGPELTPQQGAFLQAAYASFVSGARLSIVSNPSAQGYLPDGSQYTIDCVNGVCTCVVWTVGGGEDMRRSGIGISLTTLGGGLVPGHIHKDGDRPQPYILTPEVHRGTRKTTGQWRKRKVDGYSGGKAVWADKLGKKFVVGVDGVIYDSDLLSHLSIDRVFGTNTRAYWVGEYYPGAHFYTDGEKILGSFRDRNDTIPFFRKHTDGSTWLMQITPVFFPDVKLQLYGEQYTGDESTVTVGELLHELAIPAGYSMIWQTISVSPEGTGARLMFERADSPLYSKVDLDITDDSLVIASMVDTGAADPGGSVVSTTGSPHVNGTATRTETITDGWQQMPGGYGYGLRGEQTLFDLRIPFREYNYGKRTSSTTIYSTGPGTVTPGGFMIPDGWGETRRNQTISDNIRFAGTSLRYGDEVLRFPRGFENISATYSEFNRTWWAAHLGVPQVIFSTWTRRQRMTVTGEKTESIVLHLSPLFDFYVVAYYGRRYTATETSDNLYTSPPPNPIDSSTFNLDATGLRRIAATHRGQEVLSVETETPDDSTSPYRLQYVVSSAADPLTGAVCVNILEIDTLDSIHAPPLRSWILLADDKSAKHLHEVMDIPEGTGIRIKKDYALLSVV